ncbi:aldo/keto reductase [Periweissella fabalis]|uniref:Aldo/keto reductase n=1 Tax=Periweissella fabalis TaxID=1070421 RepID=A0A7X6N2M2_9LACO|nr:aldo/keto reductase [Periweissella fabalis]MCM0598160.1 aldo/keto reductase [Periweissella fabalis]NKZ24716.1 aldo/keto reductase [Periweissella fabalis]
MEKTQIANTSVFTPKLGLGTNKVGGHNLFNNLSDEDGIQVVKTALNQGITLLDTAYVYGLGQSETLIGQVLGNYDRSKIIIATKAAHDVKANLAINNAPNFLTRAVDDALQRLQTDYLDIFYIHFPDETTPKAEAVGALQKLKEAGKIRAIGISNFSLDQVKEANADGYVDIVEDAYSLVERQAEIDLLPYLQANQISFIPYFPLASGLLTGKYKITQEFKKEDWQYGRPNFQNPRYAQILAAIDNIKPIAGKYEATITQILLAWYLQNPAITAVIPGARLASQVLSNAKSVRLKLTREEYQLIDQAFKC